jgi:hypothetical protein
MNRILTLIALVAIHCIIVGCSPVENSAQKVLENAGSVVKSGADKLFIEVTPTPEPY